MPAGVILAAGASTRMKRPKPLLKFDGRTALDRELRRLNLHKMNQDQLAQRFHYQHADELAVALQIDPLELRLKNAAREGTRRVDGK